MNDDYCLVSLVTDSAGATCSLSQFRLRMRRCGCCAACWKWSVR